MDFVIDTAGSLDNIAPCNIPDTLISKLLKEYKEESVNAAPQCVNATKISKDSRLVEQFFQEMGWESTRPKTANILDELTSKQDVAEVLSKSVLTPEFDNAHTVPPYEVSEKVLKRQRKEEAGLTKGKKWYGLPATEMTDEVKRDLEIIKMRSVLDPKRFYKKNDLKVIPKYFQVGKVLDSPLDYYSNRLTKKERKNTLVEELLADAEFNKYNKRKYKEVVVGKQKTHYKAWRQAKKLKKNK